MKIAINNCYGGFGLSHEAIMRYAKLSGITIYVDNSDKYFKHYYTSSEFIDDNYFSDSGIKRTDPVLVLVIEQMGTDANSSYAELKIIDIPDDIEYAIKEYDGIEWVAEKHRTWE